MKTRPIRFSKNVQKTSKLSHDSEATTQKQSVTVAVLQEDQVGITEFVSAGKGFSGILKSRFSDFHVNEIDTDNKVLHLTDLSVPQSDNFADVDEDEAANIKKDLEHIIPQGIWEKIELLAKAKGGSAEAAQVIEIDVDELDKETRTKIHAALKKLYKGKLVSTTTNVEKKDEIQEGVAATTKKYIRVLKPKNGQCFKRWEFPGEFVHFLIQKENLDTAEVAGSLADKLKLPVSNVNYCGTKDKRGVTTQKFCIKHRTPSQIVAAVRLMRNVKVGNFEFSKNTLKLGDLKGNRFRIAIRHIEGDESAITEALEKLALNGFINYFGLQRFGKCLEVPTYVVGLALLKSDYKLACELIMKPRENDHPWLKAIREKWWKDRDSKAAAASFRKHDTYLEKRLLEGLAKYGNNDYSAALRKIPRNMLLLYLHAFQSYIFNQIASRRIKEYGLNVMEGDLVFTGNDTSFIDDNVEVLESGSTDVDSSTNEGDAKPEFKHNVKSLSAEDVASGSYTAHDIVLPLPGYDIKYPENIVGKWYEELLREYDLTSEKLRHNVKTYSLAGAYRKMLIKPEKMQWEFRSYDDDKSPLILSDVDVIYKKNASDTVTPTEGGKHRALLIDFCLPTSAYATMLIRELLKVDTSSSYQTNLQNIEIAKAEQDKNTKPEDSTMGEKPEASTSADTAQKVPKRALSSVEGGAAVAIKTMRFEEKNENSSV